MKHSTITMNCEACWKMQAALLASATPEYKSARGKWRHCCTPRTAQDRQSLPLTPGMIVSFRFPRLDKSTEGPDWPHRPCLVIERSDATKSVLLAYGTSRFTNANCGYEIRLNEEFDDCGLTRPTRFVLDRRLRVSLRDPRFDPRGATPVLGCLPGSLLPRLDWLHECLRNDYNSEALRHVHEWIGADSAKDRGKIAAMLKRLSKPRFASAA